MYRIVAGIVSVTAVAALAVAMAGNSVAGVANPIGDSELMAATLAVCDFPGTKIRPGAMVRDITGGFSVAATAADGSLGFCTNSFNGNTLRSIQTEPPEPADAKIGRTHGHGLGLPDAPIGYTAVGYAAPDVARVEILMPDGTVVTAATRAGTFAYTVRGFDLDTVRTTNGRAFDTAGGLVYEGPIYQMTP
ncbi:hypothetical protein [Alloactinosynnema sp. L-07]|uniref:hypothetical protein n=1 Tax=Alloactinosynnema sp. L-07 TaxID=1653480 RepID=UPI00065F04E8|nr:hypothetical protein [Alloactinosynnema sp. L-07]CRK61168.1 hypothetical protein [Alloactinosynnema sp. L-07]